MSHLFLVDRKIKCIRDTRIDVFRALALLTIFINHIPGTVYEYFTHRNFGFSDATEAFVLISGMACGLAYGTKFHDRKCFFLLKIWRRAFTLYSAHILMTCATLTIFCGASVFMQRPELLSEINISPLVREPAKAVVGIVTLGHQLGYNNILPLYMALMLVAPFMLYLAGKNRKLLLLLSGLLYLFSGFYNLAPANYPTGGVWFLNPLSWQFLFAIGLAATVHIRQTGSLSVHPVLVSGSFGYLVLSFVWVRWNLWWIDTSLGLPNVLTGFDKTYLSLPRLLHILALACVITAVPALSSLARTGTRHPLAVLGKYSLPVFVTGTLLSMTGQVLKHINPGSFFYDTLLLASGIAAQFALAYYLEWLCQRFAQQEVISLKNQTELAQAAVLR